MCFLQKSNKDSVLALIDIVLCVVLSIICTAASKYISNGSCIVTMVFVVCAFIVFVFLICSTYCIRYFILRVKIDQCNNSINVGLSKYINRLMTRRHHIEFVAGIIFCSWLISLVCLYPGTCINDTWNELQQYIAYTAGEGSLSDHHPFTDTLIMGTLIVPLSMATGKWHVVMFIYVLLQAIFTCFAFSYTVDYAYKKLKLNEIIIFGLIIFYCACIVYPTSVQTISKDSLFSWIFVIFMVYYIEIVRTEGACLLKKNFLVLFIIVALMCCLTKKIGIYIILASLLLLLVQRNNRKKVIFSITAVVMIIVLVVPIVKSQMGIVPGGKQEMFSLPFQMTARYVRDYHDEVSKEEKLIIDRVLDYDDLAKKYDPLNADPVKQFSQKGQTEDYVNYIKLWFKQGLKHPKVYIDATNAMLSGWFSFVEYKPLMNMDWHSALNPDLISEWVTIRGWSEKIAKEYQSMFDYLYNNPLTHIFLAYGFYSALIPAFAIGTTLRSWKKKKKYWIVIVPIVLSIILGCWLGPLSIHFEGRRYLYPIVYTSPLLIMWCLYVYKDNSSGKNGKCEQVSG